MKKNIYRIDLEEGVDILSYSNKPHLKREIWLFFDSSVFVELTNFFVKKTEVANRHKSDFKNLVSYLSTTNINIHPLSLIEAAREKKNTGKLNEQRWIDHLYGVLLAQCVSIEVSSLETPFDWTISREREKFILGEYAYLYPATSLDQLAVHIFRNIFGEIEQTLAFTIQYNEKVVSPFLKAIRYANSQGRKNFEKLEIFFAQISNLPFCPKIVDYCLRLILEKPSEESLINGALAKIGSELENSAWDISIVEQSQFGNFSEPFEDIKPIGIFYTCDGNQYYYGKLGRPLIINILNKCSRIYFPNLQFEKVDRKSIQLIINYYGSRFPEDPNVLKSIIIDDAKAELHKKGELNVGNAFIEKLEEMDFSKFSIYRFFSECKSRWG